MLTRRKWTYVAVCAVVVAEWLRRWTRNPLGFPRAGSNPANNGCLGYVAVWRLEW